MKIPFRLSIWFLLMSGVVALAMGNNGVPPWFGSSSKSCVSSSYTGPGNIVSGATAWWGTRAFDAVHCGSKAINVCNVSDVVCADMFTNPSTGDLIVTSIGGSDCSMVTCTIKTAYDQTGLGACQAGTAPCDITQAVIADRPTLSLSCIGALACMACNGSQWLQTVGNSPAVTQPFTVSAVGKRIGAANGGLFSQTTLFSGPQMIFLAANTVSIYDGGTPFAASAMDGAPHAMQGVYLNASSTLAVDGSSSTGGSVGTGTGGGFLLMCSDRGGGGGGFFLTGQVMELGYWNTVGFSGGQITSVNSNQHTYWGF